MRKKASPPAPTPAAYAAISDADLARRGVPPALIPALRAAVTAAELEAFLACLRIETAAALAELAASSLPAPREAVDETSAARVEPPPPARAARPRPSAPPPQGGAVPGPAPAVAQAPPASGGVADVVLDDFYVPTRMVEWAYGKGISTLRELARISPADLRATKGMGELTIQRTRAFIEKHFGAPWESLCAAKSAETSPPTAPVEDRPAPRRASRARPAETSPPTAPVPPAAPVDDGEPPDVLDLALDKLNLPSRMVMWVHRKGLSTLRELAGISPENLLAEKKMGRLTIHRTRLVIEPRLGRSWEVAGGHAPVRARRGVLAPAAPQPAKPQEPIAAPPLVPAPPEEQRSSTLREELVGILRARGGPMMRGELVGELGRRTDASAKAIDKALHRAPFMRLEHNCYGLVDRDLPGRARAAAKAADHLAALLVQRGTGLGAGSLQDALAGLSPAHARWTREMCLTALRGDARFVQSASGAVGLASWKGVRLLPREDLARECLKKGRGRVRLSTLKQRIEEVYGEPPTQKQLWALASRLGASVGEGWLVLREAITDGAAPAGKIPVAR